MKRKKLGKTINWQRTYQRDITKEEKLKGSPYWAWVEKHGEQDEDGIYKEPLTANPDAIGEVEEAVYEPTPPSLEELLPKILSEQELEIVTLMLGGFSQKEIGIKLNIKQQVISKRITKIREIVKKELNEVM